MADHLVNSAKPFAVALDALLSFPSGSMSGTSSLPAVLREKLQRRVHSQVQSCNSGTAMHPAARQSHNPASSRCQPATNGAEPHIPSTHAPSPEACACPRVQETPDVVAAPQRLGSGTRATTSSSQSDEAASQSGQEGNGSGNGCDAAAAPCASGQDVESCRERSPQSGTTACHAATPLPSSRKRQHEAAQALTSCEHEGSNDASNIIDAVLASCDKNGPHLDRQTSSAAGGSQADGDRHEAPDAQQLLPGAAKRARIVWTADLHQRFVAAVGTLGAGHCMPNSILQLMDVDGMTRNNVASHLQKYRQTMLHAPPAASSGAPAPPSIIGHQMSSPASSLSSGPFPVPVLIASLQQQQQQRALALKPPASVPPQPISFRQQRQQVLALQQAAMTAASAAAPSPQEQLMRMLTAHQQPPLNANMCSGFPAPIMQGMQQQQQQQPMSDAACRSIDGLSRQMSLFSSLVQQHLAVYGASQPLEQLQNSFSHVSAMNAQQQQQQQFGFPQFGGHSGWMGVPPPQSNLHMMQGGQWY